MQVDGFSLDGQITNLRRFADREEMIIIDTYEDAGKSGKSIEGRPAFKKMLSDIENGLQVDYILVYKLSRFGRNAADILNSLEFIQSYGINLICIEEGIDSSQASGKLLISVLSAVAEIERENILEQTMNGRKEKARQGGWNGGFAPYGYYLKDKQLFIQEEEAEAIRIIYDKFASTSMGYGGVAQYLNLQGIKKIQRQNGKLSEWSGHFVRLILDNPVYFGKIAFGRRAKEKIKGTKNQYRQAWQDEYILADGLHEAIISEELWNKVREKRIETGVKQPSKVGKDRAHLLTGLLKCPACGGSMYTNKHAWTNKDGTYKEVYYYVCSRNRNVRGKSCTYKAMLKKTEIEPLVIEAIRELVSNEAFAKEVKSRIGTQIDTVTIDREIKNYADKLREVDLNKARLENEIDTLPEDTRYRERKLHDMTIRLDGLYDIIVELEEKIEDAKLKRRSVEMNAITLDNVYKLMINFEKMYDRISDKERKALVSSLIKEIQIYTHEEADVPLKSISFNFPVLKNGKEVQEFLWDKGNTVETIILLQSWKLRKIKGLRDYKCKYALT
jgi:site-specific DNA recombinase